MVPGRRMVLRGLFSITSESHEGRAVAQGAALDARTGHGRKFAGESLKDRYDEPKRGE
jgi:hypothetical protein